MMMTIRLTKLTLRQIHMDIIMIHGKTANNLTSVALCGDELQHKADQVGGGPSFDRGFSGHRHREQVWVIGPSNSAGMFGNAGVLLTIRCIRDSQPYSMHVYFITSRHRSLVTVFCPAIERMHGDISPYHIPPTGCTISTRGFSIDLPILIICPSSFALRPVIAVTIALFIASPRGCFFLHALSSAG